MKKRISLILLLVTIMVTQVSFIPLTVGLGESTNIMSQQIDSSIKTDVGIIPPAPYGGVENIQSSHFRNPGFEEDNGYNKPEDYDSGSTTTKIIDSAYQTEVHSGTYGAYVKVQGNDVDSSFDSNRRNFPEFGDRAYVDEILELDFWYNCKANPDITTNGYVNVRFQIMSDVGNIYLFYYLSSNTFPSGVNNSAYGYFDIRGSIDSWINIDRNITEDFIAVFPARILSQCYIRQIYFDCYSPPNPSGAVELLFDDVVVSNSTGFDYLADNGDFEDGDADPWRTYQSDAGYAFLTENDYTQGQKSMNMTAYSTATDSVSQAWINRYHSQAWQTFPKGLFAQQSGEYLIEFDWKYTDTSSSLVEYANVFLGCQNETYTLYIYIYLGSSTDSLPGYTNYTGATYANLYIKADDFSVRNTWNHFSVDYYDLITSLGFSNLATNSFQITAYTNGADARVQLLVDELNLLVYPLSDPSFENNWEWQSNDPLLAWITNYNDNYVNRTSDAYSGNYAANVTSFGGVEAYCQREMWLPVDDNQFLDFWWKLDKITNTGSGSAYSHIAMQIDEGLRSIYYVLSRTELATYTNSSDRVCYYVEGMNTTGSWMNLFRNLSEDIIDAFGDNNWNITTIQLNSQADGTTVCSTLFDDLHFVEDNAGPTITNLDMNPLTPEHFDTVDISVEVVDSSQVDIVELHYKYTGFTWVVIPMALVMDEYIAAIPGAAYGIEVDYYITAEDVYGHTSQLGSGTSPYTYIVGDYTPPDVTITTPVTSAVVSDDLLIETDIVETASGIDYVEFYDGSTLLGTDASAPYNYLWDTRTASNGEHTIIVIAYDNVGLYNSSGVVITLDNDFDAPVISNLQLNPLEPVKGTPVEVSVEVTDDSAIKYVQIFYRIDSGTWTTENMTLSNGNYIGEIPGVGFKSTVDYFIKACDINNYVELFGDTTDYYSYTIPYTGQAIGLRFVLPIGIGAVGISVGILFLVRFIKRRKVA